MSTEVKTVVVIQDASRDVSSMAISGILHDLALKPGDDLTLLGVLHQVNNPCTFSFMRGRKIYGGIHCSFFSLIIEGKSKKKEILNIVPGK